VQANAAFINAKNPTGTGERDYALLFVYEAIDDAPLPATFPYLAINTGELTKQDVDSTVRAAGYPATPLYENGANAPLPQVVAESTIGTIYTFSETVGDVISMPVSPVSATGASGGPVINDSGEAIGVIATRSDDPKDSLRALSIDYINRTIEEETGLYLEDYLRGDLAVRSRIFNDALTPFLTQLLEFELE
jgi:Trypsin-like peptidase domain